VSRAGLLGFLADLDSQARTVELELPADDPILYELASPDAAEVSIKASAMCRVVDVRAALDGVPIAGDDRELVFEVDDPCCPWNRGRWRARARGGAIEIAGSRDEPAATLSIGALTQLVAGAAGAADLIDRGAITGARAGDVELLEAVAGGRTPYHAQHY
jgi:predicted acetyltransferase